MSQTDSIKILLVEDDANLGYLLKNNFEQHGYSVTIGVDGKQGFKLFRQQEFHICILDVMLPLQDGFSLAGEIKNEDDKMPVIFLTSRSMEIDKIRGFHAGCDDYITKPFSMMELMLRINAVLKRSAKKEVKERPSLYRIGKFTFDLPNRLLQFPDTEARLLSMKEAELLGLLCERPNELIHRQHMLNKVWGNDDYFVAKSMDVFITRLRKLLRSDSTLEIQNVYGTGFKLVIHTER